MENQPTRRLSGQSFAQKAGRMLLLISSVLLTCIVVLVGGLLAWSPGKPKPFIDKDGRPVTGSIAEKIFVNINGVEQGMFIIGQDINNPVLLFVHGGLGMPEYWLTER